MQRYGAVSWCQAGWLVTAQLHAKEGLGSAVDRWRSIEGWHGSRLHHYCPWLVVISLHFHLSLKFHMNDDSESCVNEQGHYSISRDSTVKRYMPMSENGHPVIAIVFVVESFSRFVFLCLR